MGCNMRNGRKGDIRTCLFLWVWWLSSYITEPHLEIEAAFPDSPVRLWIAAYAKLAPVGAQTSNAAIARTGRISKDSPYFHLGVCI